jgi:hypothetical protein
MHPTNAGENWLIPLLEKRLAKSQFADWNAGRVRSKRTITNRKNNYKIKDNE